MVVKSRGYGKTWLTALCCIAMGVLYPGSLIAVVSGTAEQATLIVKKIQDYFTPQSGNHAGDSVRRTPSGTAEPQQGDLHTEKRQQDRELFCEYHARQSRQRSW